LEPQVLLFDEPLSNLDAKLRRQVREEIREIQQNLGLTVVYVTHDQEEALAVSDEIVVMYNAGIAQIGSPRDLYDAPADRFVADFIGEANIISCEIVAVSGDAATINIAGFIHTLPSHGLSVGPAQLAVRPTRLIMNAPSGITVTVQKATYVGSRMEYTFKAEFGTLFSVSENVDEPLKVGQSLTVGLDKIGPVLLPKI
jgi:iron(III) transport system ATP-binding protein